MKSIKNHPSTQFLSTHPALNLSYIARKVGVDVSNLRKAVRGEIGLRLEWIGKLEKVLEEYGYVNEAKQLVKLQESQRAATKSIVEQTKLIDKLSTDLNPYLKWLSVEGLDKEEGIDDVFVLDSKGEVDMVGLLRHSTSIINGSSYWFGVPNAGMDIPHITHYIPLTHLKNLPKCE